MDKHYIETLMRQEMNTSGGMYYVCIYWECICTFCLCLKPGAHGTRIVGNQSHATHCPCCPHHYNIFPYAPIANPIY